jgi:hypothetical protein
VTVEPGSVYKDDETIPDDEVIYRMILASNTKWSDAGHAERAGTNAFQDRPEADLQALGVPAVAVSVHLESEMRSRGVSVEDLVERWGSKYGVASILAGEVRALGQGITRWPTSSDPEHGMIFVKLGLKKTGGQSKQLAKCSTIVIAPPRSP